MKKYLWQNKWHYLAAGISLVVSVCLDIWFPLITMGIVDEVIVGGRLDQLGKYLFFMLIVGIGRSISQYAKDFLCNMAGCNVAENMRKDLLAHIQRLSRNFFDANNTGELLVRVKDDEGLIWDMVGFCGMLMTEAIIFLVAAIVAMLRLDWRIALIPICFLPLLTFLVIKMERKLDQMYGQISDENSYLTRTIEENISGVRTVKAFAAQELELQKFDEKNTKYSQLNVEQARYLGRMEPIINTIPKLMQILVLVVGSLFVINGHITYGVLVAFLQYSANIIWPIENMGWLTNMLSAGYASYKKVRGVFQAEAKITEVEHPISREDVNGTLVFEQVGFSLGDTQILNDISFTLEPGKTLGIMGATGAGKTSVVNLIQRFYDVTEGAISIDGVDLRELSLESVRDYSSVVSQDVFLFSDTICENVRLGHKKEMTQEKVEGAVQKAHAAEFVEKLSDGYNTVIGERGIGLSGGQKQRLSIARALAKKAGVLIMDDSTSALDMETERAIQKEIGNKKDMSKIIIAHRISSVKDADEIIVLEHGRIAERGTHESLIEQRGLYFSTYEAQYGNYHEALRVMKATQS